MKESSSQYAQAITPGKNMTAQHARWFLLALLLPLIAGVAVYKMFPPADAPAEFVPTSDELTKLSKSAFPELPLPHIGPASPDAAILNTVKFVVRRNDTMERIFRQLKLNLTDLATVREMPEVKKALEVLRPGELITLIHADGLLQGMTRRLSNTSVLSITREGDGFKAQVIETPVDIKIASVHGTVDSSLFASAHEAGLSAELIMRLADDIFGWDIDFALNIQPGDAFTVIYEQQYRGEEYLGDGRILAAEFVNEGHAYRAVRYDSADGKIANYFTPDGRSMHKQFLRAPVDFTRISSGFSFARLHPILNTIRAHKGVDYAAPTGTPIRAAADGRVSFAGVQGGYGNVVIIEHGAGISTLYGHMSRFVKNIHAGSHVQQGETVGYVGQTGAATGPHLHYEYRVNGVHRDPQKVKPADAAPISAEYMAEFHKQTDMRLTSLDRLSHGEIVAGPTSH